MAPAELAPRPGSNRAKKSLRLLSNYRMDPLTDHPGAATSSVARASLSGGAVELFQSAAYTRRYPPHFHETYAIGLVESGQAAIRTMRGSQLAGPGDILLFAPGEIHAAVPVTAEGYGYRMMYPPVELIHEMLGTARRKPFGFLSAVARDASLAADIASFFRVCAEHRHAEGRLVRVARGLAQHSAQSRGGVSRARDRDVEVIERARAVVSMRLGQRMSLADLAVECGTTRFRLIRIFQRVLGVTPYAYVLQARLNRARALLSRGLPIVRVALDCGFNDQSHLTRAFRDVVGVPPGQYQRSVAQMR